MQRTIALLLLAAALIAFAACGDDDNGTGNGAAEPTVAAPDGGESGGAGPPPVEGDESETASGLRIVEIAAGSGDAAENGSTVSVHYTGWLSDGTEFDSSHDRGEPIQFVLGAGRVIPGWEEGLLGMQVGGMRRLIIPPELAYGEQGRGAIPPDAELTFDVELVAVE